LHQSIAALDPTLAERVHEIHDWKQVALLSVAADRLPRWYAPGLLLIGDAAHVMSPAGGSRAASGGAWPEPESWGSCRSH